MSLSIGAGFVVAVHGESVVPAIVNFCHGRKKITRPSDVFGSSKPMSAGLIENEKVIFLVES